MTSLRQRDRWAVRRRSKITEGIGNDGTYSAEPYPSRVVDRSLGARVKGLAAVLPDDYGAAFKSAEAGPTAVCSLSLDRAWWALSSCLGFLVGLHDLRASASGRSWRLSAPDGGKPPMVIEVN